MFKISQTCFAAWQNVQIILHAEAKAWVFANGFCSHFIGRGFTSRSKLWIKLRSNTGHYHFCFLKSRNLLEIRDLYSKPIWQRTDFVNTRLYLPWKASLISVSELSDPKTTALTPFSFRLDTWSFIKEIKEEITRQTVSKTSVSPCSKNQIKYKRPNVKC